jgi:hypothetical protein
VTARKVARWALAAWALIVLDVTTAPDPEGVR